MHNKSIMLIDLVFRNKWTAFPILQPLHNNTAGAHDPTTPPLSPNTEMDIRCHERGGEQTTKGAGRRRGRYNRKSRGREQRPRLEQTLQRHADAEAHTVPTEDSSAQSEKTKVKAKGGVTVPGFWRRTMHGIKRKGLSLGR